jgi:hypothetical protein
MESGKRKRNKRAKRAKRKDGSSLPWAIGTALLPLYGLYRLRRFIGAERRALEETRDALQFIREDTVRRLAAQASDASTASTATPVLNPVSAEPVPGMSSWRPSHVS